jgi:hypothetical protein
MADAGDAVIQRLLAEAAQLWPEAPPSTITLARKFSRPYSTVYRLVLGYEKSNAEAPQASALYAKVFRPSQQNLQNQQKYLDRLRTEFEVARQLRESLCGQREAAIVRPVAYYPELLALVTDEAPGKSLAEIVIAACKRWSLRNALHQAVLHCRRAGIALAAIQSATPEPGRFDTSEFLEYVQIRLERLRASAETPFSNADHKCVRDFLEHALTKIPRAQLAQCGCHGDYAPFNLLADKERVTVLDFSMFKTGSCYNDAAYFHHRVEGYLHKPVFSASAIRAVQSAFLEGYNQALGRERAPIENDLFFRLMWMKHVINNYSAIVRNRTGQGRRQSLPVRAFNQHVFRRYNEWLINMSRENERS